MEAEIELEDFHKNECDDEVDLSDYDNGVMDGSTYRSGKRKICGIHLTMRNALITFIGIIIVFVLSIALLFGLYRFYTTTNDTTTLPTTPNNQQTFTYPHAAVASDNANCSIVGSNIMKKYNGNAVDAAIATALCLGVLQQFSSGLGGGGVAIVYIAEEKQYYTIDYREFAPGAASYDMFAEFPSNSSLGGKSIAVPGELAGMIYLWNKYGQANWEDLFMESITIAEASLVSPLLAAKIEEEKAYILGSPTLASVFAPKGVLLKEGDILKQPALAETLRTLSQDPYTFYNGSMANTLVQNIQDAGGIITIDDFERYLNSGVHLRNCTEVFYHGFKIIGAPPPFSGGVCSAMVYNLIEPYNFALMGENSSLAQHYLIEAWKWAYSDRMGLGDPDFVDMSDILPKMLSKDHAATLRQKFSASTTYPTEFYVDLVPPQNQLIDSGTTHLSVVDTKGNAVAMTSTVNLYFGSKVLSVETGIIFNDQMDDFSSPDQYNSFGLPDSEANYIAPYKKPLSSMNPTIVLLNDELFMLAGAAGGPTIITSVIQTVIGVIDFDRSIGDAIGAPRCHDQNTGETEVEKYYSEDFISFLDSTHHNITRLDSTLAVVQGITINYDGTLSAASDWRKLGLPCGF